MLISGNGPGQSNQTQQMNGTIVVDTSLLFDNNNNKTSGVSSKRKVTVKTEQTQEMNGTTSVDIPMMATKTYNKIDVLSWRNEAGKINETQEVYGATIGDMSIMEAMTHNKNGVPSLISGAGQRGEKQEIQGAPHDIQKMEVGNPIKFGVNIRSMRQGKRKKSQMMKMRHCMQNGERILWCNKYFYSSCPNENFFYYSNIYVTCGVIMYKRACSFITTHMMIHTLFLWLYFGNVVNLWKHINYVILFSVVKLQLFSERFFLIIIHINYLKNIYIHSR